MFIDSSQERRIGSGQTQPPDGTESFELERPKSKVDVFVADRFGAKVTTEEVPLIGAETPYVEEPIALVPPKRRNRILRNLGLAASSFTAVVLNTALLIDGATRTAIAKVTESNDFSSMPHPFLLVAGPASLIATGKLAKDAIGENITREREEKRVREAKLMAVTQPGFKPPVAKASWLDRFDLPTSWLEPGSVLRRIGESMVFGAAGGSMVMGATYEVDAFKDYTYYATLDAIGHAQVGLEALATAKDNSIEGVKWLAGAALGGYMMLTMKAYPGLRTGAPKQLDSWFPGAVNSKVAQDNDKERTL